MHLFCCLINSFALQKLGFRSVLEKVAEMYDSKEVNAKIKLSSL